MIMRPSIVKVNFLDLRGCGLSILERLCLEEFLYQVTDIQTNWFIIGYHEATQHRYFINPPKHQQLTTTNNNTFRKPIQYINNDSHYNNNDGIINHDIIKQMDGDNRINDNVAIILGFGGKPKDLLNIPLIQQDSVTCIKRFTGGGTVVLDTNSIWTTIIGRPNSFYSLDDITTTNNIDANAGSNNNTDKQSNAKTNDPTFLPFYPRNIMDWTSKMIFQPMFQLLESKYEEKQIRKTQNTNNQQQQNDHHHQQQKTMIMDTKSCSANDNSGRVLTIPFSHDNNQMKVNNNRPNFVLQENDYVFMFPNSDNDTTADTNNNDNSASTNRGMISKKIGGNAQSIGKNGFLHHTSFLWDYDITNMENYLLIPKKRPEYRSNRSHEHFITSIKSIYPNITPTIFCKTFYDICYKQFHNNQINQINSIKSDHNDDDNTNLLLYQFHTCTIQDVMSLVRDHSTNNNWNTIGGSHGLQGWYEHKSRNKVLTDIDFQ